MSLAPPIPLSTPGITINDNPLNAISDPSQIDKKDPLQANDSPRSSLDGEKGKSQHRALEPVMSGPKFNIRILLMSGQSHTFSFPPETNIGQLKNLVWGEWPDEWNADPSRPPAPNYFRLLYLGRMLLDPEVLAGLNLQPAPGSTIIHLSIRTFAPQPEEPVKRSILPFSLPTIPRPSGLSSRQNSTNVATTIPPGSGGTTGSTHVPSSARADVAAGDAQPVPVTTTATTTRRIESEGEHGGGCKCLIM